VSALRWPAIERLYVVLVALHSLAIGVVLLFLTEWGLAFGGFHDVRPLFFPRQAGAFHLVVAAAYLYDYLVHGRVTVMVMTKCLAVVFLCGVSALTPVPWLVPLSALGDGLMAALAVFVHRGARGARP
jgi:hypothetical protein